MRTKKILMGMSTLLIAASASAEWVQIHLDQFNHGQVVTGTTTGPTTFNAVNFHHADSQLVAFDTRQRDTRDPDIEGPNEHDGRWTKGNLATDEVVGTVLILQAIDDSFAGYTDASQTTVAQPDDEERSAYGSRPGAGEVTLELDQTVFAFRFTMLDVEPTGAFEDRSASYVVYGHGKDSVKITFADLIDPSSEFYDPTIRFGDGSANRFPIVTADQLGLPGIDRVVINLGGSGAIGGLGYIEEQPNDIGFTQEFAAFDGLGSTPFDSFWLGDGQGQPYTYGSPGGGSGGSPPGTPPKPRDPRDPPQPPTAVPTPGAGLAGTLLISLLAAKRPRRKTLSKPI
ncbi:MAG: hypothetical protein AB8C95_01475 [Phycisphaeraceae bacterium]